jgi:hypothetical protein
MEQPMQTVDTVLNPSRQNVRNLTHQALTDSEGDPAQVFADLLMTAATIAALSDIDVSEVQPMFDKAMPNAVIAAEFIMANVGDTTDG